MTWQLEPSGQRTRLDIVAENVPDAISADDHAAGMASSLANLARHVEGRPSERTEAIGRSGGLHGLDGLDGKIPRDLRRFLGLYGFAISEITTKLEILRGEYTHLHDRNPIENISSRLKAPQGIIDKRGGRGSASATPMSGSTSATSPVSGSPAASCPMCTRRSPRCAPSPTSP